MRLTVENYLEQKKRWPSSGKHILAQFNESTIVVYQAYRSSIGHAAANDGHFGGGGFSFDRMSWIKPNFLWMMYRSGWATKEGQEVTLAIGLRRSGFEEILERAVHSSFKREIYGEREQWQKQVKRSDVRLQWDPDHSPSSGKLERRAIQLGLRGETLRKYSDQWIDWIEDISDFVEKQRKNVGTSQLLTPSERVYPSGPLIEK